MGYSVDLRKKVVGFIERTKNMLEASRVFGINYNTVRKWFSLATTRLRGSATH